MSRQPTPPDPAAGGDELRSLLQRAERGDTAALPALRLFLDERPEVWREAGDLGLQARRAWAALAAGPNLLISESVRRRYEEVLAAAAGPAPAPLEELLAERVALTWLASNYFDVILAQKRGQGLTPAQVEHLQRCQERGQRQHLLAVKTLATVRKLLPKAPGGDAERGEKSAAGLAPDQGGVGGGHQGATPAGPRRRGRKHSGRAETLVLSRNRLRGGGGPN